MTPLRDYHLGTYQILRGTTRIFAIAYYLQLNNASHAAVGRTMCHAEQRVPHSLKECLIRSKNEQRVPHSRLDCETLIRSFTRAQVGTDSDKTASSLLSRLQQKKQERWEEAVNSIGFSQSSRKAWRTINKLTGRSGRSFHQCPSRQTLSPLNL